MFFQLTDLALIFSVEIIMHLVDLADNYRIATVKDVVCDHLVEVILKLI